MTRSSLDWRSTNRVRHHQYVALKIYVHSSLVHRELPFYQHVAGQLNGSKQRGARVIRQLLDSFKIKGPDGEHWVLVFQAAQMSLREMRIVSLKDGFKEDLVKGSIFELLTALDFLHTQGIVHTGECHWHLPKFPRAVSSKPVN